MLVDCENCTMKPKTKFSSGVQELGKPRKLECLKIGMSHFSWVDDRGHSVCGRASLLNLMLCEASTSFIAEYLRGNFKTLWKLCWHLN